MAYDTIFFPDNVSSVRDTDASAGNLGIGNGKIYFQIGAIKLQVESDRIGYDPASHDLSVANGGRNALT